MVINPNTQAAAALNPSAANQTKSAARPNSSSNGNGISQPEEVMDAVVSSRIADNDLKSSASYISDEHAALGVMEYVRNFIGSNPIAAMGVQGNPRPETVLELLQGAFAE
jgi:hypothetical protein